MTVLDTSTTTAATSFSNQRKLARTSTGRLWAIFAAGSDLELWYSDDDGGTWTQNTNGTITGATEPSLFIDLDDHAHVAYRETEIRYRRMESIGTATSWTSATTIHTSTLARHPDLVAHREGTGWRAHVVCSDRATGGTAYVRVTVTSSGTISATTPASIGTGDATDADYFPSIDFHHTGDGKTVQGGTPHLFAVYHTGNTTVASPGIRFRRASYSSGSWTWGTERGIDTSNVASNGMLSSIFDGSRVVIAYAPSTGTATIKVAERDAGDTVTTERTPTALSDGTVTGLSVTYDGDNDIHLWAVGTTSDDVKRIQYDRSAGTWDTWTTVAAADALAGSLSLKRGYSNHHIEAVYTTGTASPYDVVHASLDLNQAPTAATWNMTDNQAHDVAATLTLDWTFTDPDAGDTQGSYAMRRQVGSAAFEYWSVASTAWVSSEVENTSSTSSLVLSSGWGADSNANHKYAVKTWDAAGLEGSYSAELTVVPSAKDNPTISSPANSGTVTGPSLTVEWTVSTQTAYRARLLSASGASLLESSGWVTTSATRAHTFAYSLANSTSYQVEIATKNDEGLNSAATTHTFDVSFTPPATPTLIVTASDANAYITAAITNPGTGATEASNDLYVRVAAGGRADGDRPVGGDGIRIATNVAVDGSYIDRAVASGVDYEFMARAIADTGATADSAWS